MCLSESIPTIDPSKLPELPPLPPALATSVFTHKSTNYLRNELMGDAVICLWVTNWITEQHDSIGAHTATVSTPCCARAQGGVKSWKLIAYLIDGAVNDGQQCDTGNAFATL